MPTIARTADPSDSIVGGMWPLHRRTLQVNPSFAVTPLRLATLALAVSLAGCTITDGLFGSKVDYKSAAGKTQALEVPPDLTQLARDSRYQPQGGVISAAAAAAGPGGGAAAAGVPSTGGAVAVSARGDLRIERQGQSRWLATSLTPEQLWPQLTAFWQQRGFTLDVNDQQIGVMETNWSENRAKLPDDVVRNTVGRLLGTLYDTGERDRYRTRVERTPSGSEIFISHRGISEIYTSERRDATNWRARPTDPQLEAEFLSRLMVTLGGKDDAPRTAVAAVMGTPEPTARARLLAGRPTPTLEVDEPFDRAWRRVGLALDRSGFTVEDRDRAGGLYYVRYVDPASAGKDEPNWFQRTWANLWGDKTSNQTAVRYRVAVQGSAEKTTVSVLTSAGAPDTGGNGQRIIGLLVNELR
jgi:outer membrane protein assembly factor BamC